MSQPPRPTEPLADGAPAGFLPTQFLIGEPGGGPAASAEHARPSADAPAGQAAAAQAADASQAEAEAIAEQTPVGALPDGSAPDVITDLGLALPTEGAGAAAKPTLSHIGRYALKERLAVGGLGAVYEAWDPLLSRTVAVKTLHFDVDTPSRVSLDGLFLNEARTAAGLAHRGIVTIHDAGLSAQGVYIAMERLVGRDLRDALASGWRPTPARAALLARRVAEALAYAHAQGVIHCDIKPANIFLTSRLRPKVLDFGIARAAGAHVPAFEGLVAGSPHYLAPEQLQGGDVDARTDVYALGVVLHELLTGRKAFDGDSLDAIVAAVLAGAVPPAHLQSPDVPEALSLMAARAMAREPAERFESAEAMALALRGWLGEQAALSRASARPAVSRGASGAAAATAAPSASSGEAAPRTARRPQPAKPVLHWFLIAVVLTMTAALCLWWLAEQLWRNEARRPRAQQDAAATEAVAATTISTATALGATAGGAVADAVGTAESRRPDAAAERPITGSASPGGGTAAAAGTKASRARGAGVPVALAAAPVDAPAMVPVAQGSLRLAVSPWAHVEVDGASVGISPPLVQLALPVGAHLVVLRNDGAAPFSATVQVDAEQATVLRHRFSP